jgi:hypothetical protein
VARKRPQCGLKSSRIEGSLADTFDLSEINRSRECSDDRAKGSIKNEQLESYL